MEEKELINNYIPRACGLRIKCISLRMNILSRELAYYTDRGLSNSYKDVREILKTQRHQSLKEIQEILKECEQEIERREGFQKDPEDVAYAEECDKLGHIEKEILA